MDMTYIGIDPGKGGGIAAIYPNGEIVAIPYSDSDLLFLCAGIKDAAAHSIACVEKVGAMPGQGVTSMFTFGKSCGYIEGVLSAFMIPYQLVPPQTWKKEFSLGGDKQKSIEVCRRLYPGLNLKRTDKCKKDHDGMAEAALMATYAHRRFNPAFDLIKSD